jgi:autotransporter-associated beta strand protein
VSATATIDVNNNGSGSGNTLRLRTVTVAPPPALQAIQQQINVTGGNNYTLCIPTLNWMSPQGNPTTLTLNPTSAMLVVDQFNTAYGTGAQYIILGGTSTGNVLGSITNSTWQYFTKSGTSTWTWNHDASSARTGDFLINGGNLIVSTGTLAPQTGRALTLQSGTLHYNNAGAVNIGSGGTAWTITGGNLDNSSGAAITNSTYNPPMAWNGDFAFLGSNGANSDLNLGTGAMAMSATRIVTVNSNATLTVGGAISGAGFGLTKAGTGTLKLGGKNTYNGVTAITNGTLAVVTGGSCSNSAVTVTNTTGITSALGVVVTNTAQPWVCTNLTVSAVAGGASQLKFAFSVTPSLTQAPLVIRNTVAFSGSPTIVVDPANLQRAKKYPLLTVGGTPPVNVPAVSITGMSGILAWEGNTLYLTIPLAGTIITFH